MENEQEKKVEKYLITERLKKEIRKDLQIDEFDLEGQCRNMTNVVQKYLEMYFSRKRLLDSLKLESSYKFADYYKKYRYGGQGVPLKADSGADAKILIERHDDYRILQEEIKKLERLVDFLDETVENMRQNFWMIKNIIAIRDMENKDNA